MKSPNLPRLLQATFTALEGLTALSCLALLLFFGFADTILTSAESGEEGVINSISVAPITFDMPTDVYSVASPIFPDEEIRVAHVQGTIEVINPSNIDALLAAMRAPMVLFFLFAGAVGVAICDLFRRLFRNVRLGDTFTAANMRNLHKIGVLVIALEIGVGFMSAWAHARAARFVRDNFEFSGVAATQEKPANDAFRPQFGLSVNDFHLEFNLAGLLGGLMILALGEVFRQGLALKEENELTI